MDAALLHQLQHPNVPFTASSWSESQTLHVATAYSNPIRWRTRRELMQNFRRHMHASPNVVLHVGELAYGDRPFEVTTAGHPLDYQWRTRHELWHKENLLGLIVQRFPPDWKYGAFVDGDFLFTRHDWALEAIHQLQHYDWIQLFSTYTDLGHGHSAGHPVPGFVYTIMQNGGFGQPKSMDYGVRGSPGGAWAFRREAFDACGGFLDVCVLGSADRHMAVGLAQVPMRHIETENCGLAYRQAIAEWQKRAAVIRHNIGYLETHALHHYHGPKDQRGYETRWKILVEFDFNPHTDIYRDAQGIYQLTANKPGLRDAIRRYFRSRGEDR